MIIHMQIPYDQAIATVKYRWLENGVRHRANVYVLDRKKAKAEMRIGDEQTYQRVKLIFAYMIPYEGVSFLRKDKLLVETFIYERQRHLRLYQKYSEISFLQFSQSTTELKEFFSEEPELLSSYEAIFYQLNYHHHLQPNYREPIGFELIKARLFHAILSASKEEGVATKDCLFYLIRLAKCLPIYGDKAHSAQVVLESSGLIKQVDGAWVITSKQLERYLTRYLVFSEVQYLDADLQQYKQMSEQSVKEASVYSIHDLSTKCHKLL